jgi:phenol 2-monooxygenase (NADPH)
MADPVDVLICGSGSAGIACALWLTIYNDRYCKSSSQDESGTSAIKGPRPITYRVLESRDGPLQLGQADGVQCRTVEIFESLGLDHYLSREAYWVNEVAFWTTEKSDDGTSKKVRTGETADVRPGLSHQPHVILNQARINKLMLEKIKQLDGTDISYGWEVKNIEADAHVAPDDGKTYPVKVTAENDGNTQVFRAKYALVSLVPFEESLCPMQYLLTPELRLAAITNLTNG